MYNKYGKVIDFNLFHIFVSSNSFLCSGQYVPYIIRVVIVYRTSYEIYKTGNDIYDCLQKCLE